MSTNVELVRRHLDAVWASDWASLRQSLADDAQLRVSSGDTVHSEWDIGGLYRFISQAWDFRPGEVQLSAHNNGIIRAELYLTNGGSWAKKVEGDYRFVGDRIASIHFVDTAPFRIGGDSVSV